MQIDFDQLKSYLGEVESHLENELLPFWASRSKDEQNGGFITHFDQYGKDSGEDEKSLVAQARLVYSFSSAHRAGYGDGLYADLAAHGLDFLLNKMWDDEFGGFFWMTDRAGHVKIDRKILYGQSFAIYALSEYALATGDARGREYAEKTYSLVHRHCPDETNGGYLEMFDRGWNLAGPGSEGGDRKTFDVHMHLMEAFTNLYKCTGDADHREKLLAIIETIGRRFLHLEYGTGISQLTNDWQVAPQIKFDIVWGSDRYATREQKAHPLDTTSYGHNAELAWLMMHALEMLKSDNDDYRKIVERLLTHTANCGIDWTHGGAYVEGSHQGTPYDTEKEFWQQAEVLVALLDGMLFFPDEVFCRAYENVHRFVFDKVIDHAVGEWRPLMTRQGEPIWTYMGHAWKANYHTVRSMLQCRNRLHRLLASR